jgi:hypothetical protein
MNKLFYFDCFALLADDWTITTKDEPATPEDSPRVLGFFLSAEQAEGHAKTLEGARQAEHDADTLRWRSRQELTRRSYFIIPVQNLKGADLYHAEDALISAARLMAQGIGGSPLELAEYTETNNL